MRGPMRRKKPTAVRKQRVKAPVIPLTSRGKPPSYFELLQEAVLTLKEAGTGASLPEIRRQLQRRYKGRFDKAGDKLLTTALQRLAERGKVIWKEGYRYKFNAPKVSKPKAKVKPSKSTGGSGSESSYSGTSRSGATSGSAPSDATDATMGNDSRTSASSSATSGTNRSAKSSAKDEEAPKDGEAVPKDESPGGNVDGEGKSSSGDDLSSSAASASSTASRRASSKRR